MKSSQRQFLVTIVGLGTGDDRYWMTKSGGEVTADSNKVYDGGKTVPEIITGLPTVENIVVSRNYDHNRDATILAQLRQQVGRDTRKIVVQPVDRDMVAIGSPTTYSECVLVRVGDTPMDANSGDLAPYELEYAVTSVV